MTTLETLVFTSDMDDRIIEVFSQVKALKQEEKVLV
jgi:nuclear cap-binding protein subunit 1